MSNSYRIIYQRKYLVEGLPEPINPRDTHWQIFDNYIENTRIRLRKIRVPETKQWTRVLEQRYAAEVGKLSKLKISQMFLNETEYKTLEHFKGREIRKNRYFCTFNDTQVGIDIFLGKLWGLNIALAEFESEKDFQSFTKPDFAVIEVTNDKFFEGENLVGKTFADVQAEYSKIKGES